MTWVAVCIGAAVGAPMRYLVDRWVTTRTTGSGERPFPWGLLVVNVTGSILAGVVLALTSGDLRLLLLTGFCGAFTTFSGFAWEVDRLWSISRVSFWSAVVAMPVACTTGFMLAWHIAASASA